MRSVGDAIVADGLVKNYVTKKRKGLLKSEKEVIRALKGVSFRVRHGEVVGLLGPNGAGKTTTIKILATLLIPDSGKATIEGYDVVKNAKEVRRRIGVMLTVEKGFYGKLTGRENLEYFGALYGLDMSEIRRRVKELMELMELSRLGAEDRLFEEYSLGMKARLALARALLKDPPVLLLDEPTLGLDPPSARKIRSLVRDLARREGKAILYTTHNMFEAELVCDRVLMINKGVIVAEGSPEELKARIPKLRALVAVVRGSRVKSLTAKLESSLSTKVSSRFIEEDVAEVKFSVEKPEEVIGELVRAVTSLGMELVRLRIEEPTLEDVFIYFTGG